MVKYSVIIPTFNRKESLLNALESVRNQTIDKSVYEIIVVDDGSADGTEEAAKNFMNQRAGSIIKYTKQKNSGCVKARNRGISYSDGDILFFTDDDCIVPFDWMEKILDGFRRYPEVVGVGGWYDPPKDWQSRDLVQKYLYSSIRWAHGSKMDDSEIKSDSFTVSPVGNTANIAFKKSVFDEAGKFDENMYFTGMVDWEFKKRICSKGYQLLYMPISVIHNKPLSFMGFMKQSFRRGRGANYIYTKYGDLKKKDYYRMGFRETITSLFNLPPYSGKVDYSMKFLYFIERLCRYFGKLFNQIIGFKFK